MDALLCNSIFDQVILDYHTIDDVDQKLPNPHPDGDIRNLLYRKNWIDTVQWHLEDLIRDPDNSGGRITALKRRIDKSNQDRTDLVENIDDWFLDKYKNAPTRTDARINTETPAWVIDRLSILALKIFHMHEQVKRADVEESHRQQCQSKLNILLEQRKDLRCSLDELLDDFEKGHRQMKVYRQMKMYNDQSLNPVLYARKSDGN